MEPDAPTEPTQIPVTTPEETSAVAEPDVAPVVDAPNPNAQAPVPGSSSVELTVGEHTGEAQPPAPNPVPATASPDTDQVTVNTHLRAIISDLEGLKTYVENFLNGHPASQSIIESLGNVVSVVSQEVK